MEIKKALLILLLSTTLLTSAVFLDAVEIGAQAPVLQVSKWLKGEALTLHAGKEKNIFIVEFWATWCGPCKDTIPHLSRMQKKYNKDGVIVIGVSSEEEAVVSAFLKEQKEMDYHVAVDDNNKTYQAYMKEFSAIPRAFIINKKGNIFWSGHPLQLEKQLDRALQKVRLGEKETRRMNLENEMEFAIENRDFMRAQLAGERILEIDPDHESAIDALFYLQTEAYKAPQKALDFIEGRLRVSPGRMPLQLLKVKALTLLEGDHQKDVRSLSGLIMGSPGVTPRQLMELVHILLFNPGENRIWYDLTLDVIILARSALKKTPDKGILIGILDNEIYVAKKLRLPERELRAHRELLALLGEREDYQESLQELEAVMKQRRKFLADEEPREEK
jgi:thiol-disulfide isomerase/thioredoxin